MAKGKTANAARVERAKTVAPATTPVTRAATHAATQVIRFTEKGARGNPKVPFTGAWELYECYGPKAGISVGAYLAAVLKTKQRPKCGRSSLAWDIKHGFIEIN
jgi:hypothetical protein